MNVGVTGKISYDISNIRLISINMYYAIYHTIDIIIIAYH